MGFFYMGSYLVRGDSGAGSKRPVSSKECRDRGAWERGSKSL